MIWLVKVQEYFTSISKTYNKGKLYDNLLQDNINLANNVNALRVEETALNKFIEEQKIILDDQDKEIVDLNNNIIFPIDEFLMHRYKTVKNIAYQGKREYPIYLNQLITPNAFEVLKFKKGINVINDYTRIAKQGDKLAKHTTWVDEGKLYPNKDRYLYPEETLTTHKRKCDCEDVSAVMTSFNPKITGQCWGFMKNGSTKFGHSFPAFLYNNKLYIVETTGNSVKIVPFESTKYEVHFIVTQDYTYRLRYGVSFGKLANY